MFSLVLLSMFAANFPCPVPANVMGRATVPRPELFGYVQEGRVSGTKECPSYRLEYLKWRSISQEEKHRLSRHPLPMTLWPAEKSMDHLVPAPIENPSPSTRPRRARCFFFPYLCARHLCRRRKKEEEKRQERPRRHVWQSRFLDCCSRQKGCSILVSQRVNFTLQHITLLPREVPREMTVRTAFLPPKQS